MERDLLNNTLVNADRACLFVLLAVWRPFNISTVEHESKTYLPKIKKYFPDQSEKELRAMYCELRPQIYQDDLARAYNTIFQSLSFERRYQICVNAYGDLHGNSWDLFDKWKHVYERVADKYFSAEEQTEVKRRIKAMYDQIRVQQKKKLMARCSEWTQWSNVKKRIWIKVHDQYSNIDDGVIRKEIRFSEDSIESYYLTACLKPSEWTEEYGVPDYDVTWEDACLWGVHDLTVLAAAIYRGVCTWEAQKYDQMHFTERNALWRKIKAACYEDIDLKEVLSGPLDEIEMRAYGYSREMPKWLETMTAEPIGNITVEPIRRRRRTRKIDLEESQHLKKDRGLFARLLDRWTDKNE